MFWDSYQRESICQKKGALDTSLIREVTAVRLSEGGFFVSGGGKNELFVRIPGSRGVTWSFQRGLGEFRGV